MFEYNGPINGFRDIVAKHGQRLSAIYDAFLKSQRRELVARVDSPKLYYSLTGHTSSIQPATSITNSIIENCQNPEFLLLTLELLILEEHLVEELDRRVLIGMGYNPTPWLESRSARNDGDIESIKKEESRQKFLRVLSWDKLLQLISDWYREVPLDNTSLRNLINSYRNYSIAKVKTEEIGGLEQTLVESRPIGFGADKDNFYCTIMVAPEPNRIEISQNGNLFLKNTSRIVTTPLIIVSQAGVEEVTSQQVKGSDLSPYLVALIHETNHFLLYALQKYPINLTASLFFSGATRQ